MSNASGTRSTDSNGIGVRVENLLNLSKNKKSQNLAKSKKLALEKELDFVMTKSFKKKFLISKTKKTFIHQ